MCVCVCVCVCLCVCVCVCVRARTNAGGNFTEYTLFERILNSIFKIGNVTIYTMSIINYNAAIKENLCGKIEDSLFVK